MSAPTIGRIVLFTQPETERPRNGSRVHPAIVTHVWGDGETPLINATVFFDAGPSEARTSVPHLARDGWGWDWPARA